MGMKPQLAEAAILVSCPCDLVAWRVGRARWVRSENPIQWSDTVNVAAKIIALTGTKDSTTSPEVVTGYIKQLKDRGVDAIFQPIPDVEHANALESEAVSDAVGRLLHR
jgi:hypothetical protein